MRTANVFKNPVSWLQKNDKKMYIPEINSKIKLNVKNDDILRADIFTSIVLPCLLFTLSSVCRALFIVSIFHTKIPQFEIHHIIISLMMFLTVSYTNIINSLFYENIEFLDKSDGLQISVQSYLTKDNTCVFLVG